VLKDLIGYRKGVIYTNLSRAFSKLSYEEIDKLANEYYTNISHIIVEIVWGAFKPLGRIKRKGLMSVEGVEALNDVYLNSNGTITMLGHVGNWELATGFLGYIDEDDRVIDYQDVVCAYHPMHSKISDVLFKRLRYKHFTAHGASFVPSTQLLRFALKNKDRKMFYILAADQYEYRNTPHKQELFGIPTAWPNGGESLARKLGMGVLYVNIVKVRRGEYIIKFEKICSDASKTQPGEITSQYIKNLERDINSYKANWLWSHKRFK